MPAGLADVIRPTTREAFGAGCWGRMPWRTTPFMGIAQPRGVFWSPWGETFIRRDLEASARFLAATLRFPRQAVLRRHGVWRKSFGCGSFWRDNRTNQRRWRW